jgi:hypothetical protein
MVPNCSRNRPGRAEIIAHEDASRVVEAGCAGLLNPGRQRPLLYSGERCSLSLELGIFVRLATNGWWTMETMIGLFGTFMAQLLLAALFIGTFFTVKQLVVVLFMRRSQKPSGSLRFRQDHWR